MKTVNLTEGLKYKELSGLIKPTIHIDEFSSKMGDDDDIVVLSFYVRNEQVCEDLISWFEKGYDFILDADRSPGEINPNRFLVYVELKRRRVLPKHIHELLEDLTTLTEFMPKDWIITYDREDYEYSPETIATVVPLSPKEYRAKKENLLNDLRVGAGIKTKPIYDLDTDMKNLQSNAGIL